MVFTVNVKCDGKDSEENFAVENKEKAEELAKGNAVCTKVGCSRRTLAMKCDKLKLKQYWELTCPIKTAD